MFFHRKERDLIEDPCSDYQVLCGIEEELLIINKDGTLINAADDVMVKAAEILERDRERLRSLQVKIRALEAEPSPSQIEYVTLPLAPNQLRDALQAGRQLLVDAANRLGVKILAQSLHPFQSTPHPIVGCHINVSAQKTGGFMTGEDIVAVNNYLWNYLPELIALSANSPIYQGQKTDVLSNRYINAKVLKPNEPAIIITPIQQPALVPMRYYGQIRYTFRIGAGDDEPQVVTNQRGDRLVDITPRGPYTNIDQDKDESPRRNRIEVRVFDVQQNIDTIVDIAYLCCASALHAVYLSRTGEITNDPYHGENIKRALLYGTKAQLIRNDKEVPLLKSVTEWVEETKKYQDMLGVQFLTSLTKTGTEPSQDNLKISVETPSIEQLRQQGKIYVVVQFNKSRQISDKRGRKYQIPQGSRVEGRLSARYNLKYKEQNGLVTEFGGIKIVNSLDVSGLNIRLTKNEQIRVALSQSEYMSRRLFGSLGFGF
ncbi:MAG: glutamate-cysteine ligase family protein [Promethearchaeota archaeon]